MKNNLYLFVSLLFLLISHQSFATTRNAGTYAELAAAIIASVDGDIINIVGDIVVTAPITINKTLIFKGNDCLITVPRPGLDEMGRVNSTPSAFNVFSITTVSKIVTLNNLSLKGGAVLGSGGTIINSGTLILNNCIISNSSAASGGGIYNVGILYLNNSFIKRNAASYGGGLLNSGSAARAYFESSTLIENRSTSSGGGGGAVENNNAAVIYFNNSTLSNNQSTEIGGAINNLGSTVWFINSSATGNVAYGNYSGGAIGNNNGTVKIVNSLLAHNYRRTTGTVTNPTGFVLDDIVAYTGQAGVSVYYSILHAAVPAGIGATASNVLYTGAISGSNNTIFSGGVLAKITDAGGLEIGEQIFRPLLYSNTGTVAPTLKSGSFVFSNKGTRTRFANNNNNVTPVVAYWNGTSYVNLTGTSAAGQEVLLDQVGAARLDPPNRGAMEGSIDNLYVLKVNASSSGSVSGGTIYGDSYPVGTSVTLTAMPNAGYTFTRWDYAVGGSGQASTSNPYTFLMPSNNVTLIPIFTALAGGQYTITYVGYKYTGGTVPAGGTFTTATTILGPGTMVRSGYTFNGWNTNPNGSGTSYATGAAYSATTNLTLYSLWLRNVSLSVKDETKRSSSTPSKFALEQNYPNPFNPSTTISFSVTERSAVMLTVYNALGQLVSTVENGIIDAGVYEYSFNASQMPSGIYFYRLEAVSQQTSGKNLVETRKMLLMK
jgi:hypothetical protein